MDSAQFLAELGEYGFLDTDLNQKVRKIQAAVWDIESRKPWPFLETSALLDFAGGSDVSSTSTADLRQVIRARDLTTGRRLTPLRLDDAEDVIGTALTEAGDPRVYYFEGSQLKFWPLPTVSTGRIKLRYIRRSPAISDSSTEAAYLIPARHHEAILLGALYRLYDMEDDVELAARFQSHYEKRIAEMEADLFKQQYDLPDFIHVIDPDDWDDENF